MKKERLAFIFITVLFLVPCISISAADESAAMIKGAWLCDEGNQTTTVLTFKTASDVHLLIHQDGKKTVDNTFTYKIDKNTITFNMPAGKKKSPIKFISPNEILISNYMGVKNLNVIFIKFEAQVNEFKSFQKADNIEKALTNAANTIIPSLQKNNKFAIVNISATDTSQSEFVANELEFFLVKAGFTLIDRSQLDIIRKEHNFQLSGDVNDTEIVSIGKLSGANALITGSISGSDATRRLRIRILDTQTAQVIAVASERF